MKDLNMKIFVILVFISGAIILFMVQKIILIKKGIVYKYIEKHKNLTSFDYVMDYDGNWLFKKIDFDKLHVDTKQKDILIAKKQIALYQKIYISIFIAILALSIFFKIQGVV